MSEIVEMKSEESGSGEASADYGSINISPQNLKRRIKHSRSSKLRWLPLLMGIFLFLSMVIPYGIAVKLGHVDPIFPYISENGTTPPEMCIFSQLMNLAGFFAFTSVYVRYKQVNEDYRQDVSGIVLKWNDAAVVFGCLAALGMSLAANFQKPNINSVHLIGGALCFGGGSIYGFAQSWISYKLSPQYCSLLTCRLRLWASIFTTVFIITNLLFDELSHLERLPEHVGFAFHIISTTSEWANAFAFIFFFLTFYREFGTIGVKQGQGY
ncbi:DNA damage-regulated autophagy modulator protein 1-like [Asterias amurensis]|uniref:DNA damage-regulated autophagy modulator protein 1-like n=1 Tax=Asterias amurensis TaxID=7602 RepID=UPI003AB61A29